MKTTLREIIETSGLDPEDGGRPEYWRRSFYMDYPAHKLGIIEGCDAWIAGEIVLVDWDSGSQFYTEAQAREEFPELFTVRDAATALGKKGCSVRSDKKTTSSRENGKKGGRPKKEVTVIEVANGIVIGPITRGGIK